MKSEVVSKKIKIQKGVKIDCQIRLSEDNDIGTILFIHGFGSSRIFFKTAFSDLSLKKFNIITYDLPGFGLSKADQGFSFSMADFARVSFCLLDLLRIDRLHLVCHSMGGLIGIEMAYMAPERILSFSNLEGNLAIEDCFISGSIIKESYPIFEKSGRKKFEKALRKNAKNDPFLFSYWQSFRKASSVALYRSAEQTVDDSKNGFPLKRFLRLKNQCYIYGEKNRNQFPGEKKLHDSGIPVFYISDAGHSMAEENPEQTYSVIGQFILNKLP
jgi:pimeloyl-ACP methyl ester carboxylesterase